MKRVIVALSVCVLPATLAAPSLAQPTVTCGRAAKATIALDDQSPELVTDASFRRTRGTRQMTLIYNVTGCQMVETAPTPQPPRIYPPRAGDAIPRGAVTFDGPPSIQGTKYIVHLEIASTAFTPGSYSGFVEINANWLHPVRTPISISRSEHRMWVPILWGAIGALGGFVLFAVLRWFRDNDLMVSRLQLGLAAAVSVGAGAFAAYTTSYLNQDVWSTTANGVAAMGVGFAASTSGVMTALLAAVWTVEARDAERQRAKTPDPGASRMA